MMEVRPFTLGSGLRRRFRSDRGLFRDGAQLGSPEADRFDLLALVIADCERKHWAIEAPVAPDLLRARMEQKALRQADLEEFLGSKAGASEN